MNAGSGTLGLRSQKAVQGHRSGLDRYSDHPLQAAIADLACLIKMRNFTSAVIARCWLN
jgi:hypothetical protein